MSERNFKDIPIESIPIKDILDAEGISELMSSPDLKPYLNYIVASMRRADIQPHLEALSKLPLEKRYVWRVASALKWGFGDFDSFSVAADRDTLNSEDFAKVIDLLQLRPSQFCLFLKALVGSKEMKRMMLTAIRLAQEEG